MSGAGIVLALVLLIAAVALWLLARGLRRSTGLPQGRVIYTDTGAWQRNEQALYSSIHRLTGKPDYLVRDGAAIVPVEVKSGRAPAGPRAGHVLQLAAYCLLVEEQFKVRPAYGIIQYADRQFAIDYTPALGTELLRVVAEMQSAANDPQGPRRSHHDPRRCATCGVRDACDESLVPPE
jgi:CRISPR-associated exonuclease Cas4